MEEPVGYIARTLAQYVKDPVTAAELLRSSAESYDPVRLACGQIPAGDGASMLKGPVNRTATVAAHSSDRELCLQLAKDPRKTVKRALAVSPHTHVDARVQLARWAAGSKDTAVLEASAHRLPTDKWYVPLNGTVRLVDVASVRKHLVRRAADPLGHDDAVALLTGGPDDIAGAALTAVVAGLVASPSRDEARRLTGDAWPGVLAHLVSTGSHVDAGVAGWVVEALGDTRVTDAARYGRNQVSFDADAARTVLGAVGHHSQRTETSSALVHWLARGEFEDIAVRDAVQQVVLRAGSELGLSWLETRLNQDAEGAHGPERSETHWMSSRSYGLAAAWLAQLQVRDLGGYERNHLAPDVAYSLLHGPVRFEPEVRVALVGLLDLHRMNLWLVGRTPPNTPGPGEPTGVISALYADVDTPRRVVGLLANHDVVGLAWRDELLELCGEALFDHLANGGHLNERGLAAAAADYLSEALGGRADAWRLALTLSAGWCGSIVDLCDTVQIQCDLGVSQDAFDGEQDGEQEAGAGAQLLLDL